MTALTCGDCGTIVYVPLGPPDPDEAARKWAGHVATEHPDQLERMLDAGPA